MQNVPVPSPPSPPVVPPPPPPGPVPVPFPPPPPSPLSPPSPPGPSGCPNGSTTITVEVFYNQVLLCHSHLTPCRASQMARAPEPGPEA